MIEGDSVFEAERLAALAGLAVAQLWTPGPNNLMLAASGATYGLRRTLPHILGVALGFAAMLMLIALILGEVFQSSALLRESLKWVGAALMLWLAWRVATAGRARRGDDAASRPFTFTEAAAFQWINPKAWSITAATSATFITGVAPVAEAAAMAGLYAVIGLTSAPAWAGFGAALQGWLSSESRLRVFNGVMGALIAAYVLVMIME